MMMTAGVAAQPEQLFVFVVSENKNKIN